MPGESAPDSSKCVTRTIDYTDLCGAYNQDLVSEDKIHKLCKNLKGVCVTRRKRKNCKPSECTSCDSNGECDVGEYCAETECRPLSLVTQTCSSSQPCVPWANCDRGICVEVLSKEANAIVESKENRSKHALN